MFSLNDKSAILLSKLDSVFNYFKAIFALASIPRENVSFFTFLSKEYQAKFSRTLEYRLVICLHRLIVNSVGTTKVFPADFYGRHFDGIRKDLELFRYNHKNCR